MSEDYRREREAAVAAVRCAAKVCQRVQSAITTDVLEKKDRSPVTIADFASQAVVCRALAEAFPDDPMIAEEDAAELRQAENAPFLDRIGAELRQVGIAAGGDEICEWIDRGNAGSYVDRFWTLDPIDGTKGFLRGEQYALSLALIVGGRIVVAALGCPNLPVQAGGDQHGAIFYAVHGQGASVLPLDGDAFEGDPIRVSATADPGLARLSESVESGHSAHDRSAAVAERLGLRETPVRLDSQAKYAVVARGEADIYLRLPTRADYREKIWDHAGGVLVVEEAGGRVTDVDGRPLEFTHGAELRANRGVVVTNGLLHEAVLGALEEV
jgi:3'(2'), 5'-bisphosphate nucleotidase